MSGTLYTTWTDALGVSHADEPVAVFENGKIYMAADGFLGTTAKGTLVGEYENGKVYTVGNGAMSYGKRMDAVALIEGGRIYGISKSMLGGYTKSLSVGECSGGKVYAHSHKFMEGSGTAGLYNGDAEGAAAAAAILLFGLTSGVSAYDSSLESDDSGVSTYSRKSSHSSSDDSGSGMGCFFSIIAGVLIFAVSIIAIIISLVAFVPTFLIYLLVKFIIKRTREEALDESDEQKRKEFVIVLVVSMLIALTMTIIAAFDSGDMVLPCIGSAIVEAIGFGWLISFVKTGKEIKFLKKFKKKKTSTETVEVRHKDVEVPEEHSAAGKDETSTGLSDKKVKTEIIEKKDTTPDELNPVETKFIVNDDVDMKLGKEEEKEPEKEEVIAVEASDISETVTIEEKTTGSRLKSTMRTSATESVVETENDRFKPAGDL